MKRWIHASTYTTSDIEETVIQVFGRSVPQVGCSYISKDGSFINIYPQMDIHEDLCDWAEDQFGIEIKWKDEEYFIREFGWVRLRSDPERMIIELPKDKPTSKQWYSISDWLDMCEDRYQSKVITVNMSVCDVNAFGELKLNKDGFIEDVLRLLKRYYATGRLYE